MVLRVLRDVDGLQVVLIGRVWSITMLCQQTATPPVPGEPFDDDAGTDPRHGGDSRGWTARDSGFASRGGGGVRYGSCCRAPQGNDHPGRLAQRESASFTPKRSLVRSQYRPLWRGRPVVSGFAAFPGSPSSFTRGDDPPNPPMRRGCRPLALPLARLRAPGVASLRVAFAPCEGLCPSRSLEFLASPGWLSLRSPICQYRPKDSFRVSSLSEAALFEAATRRTRWRGDEIDVMGLAHQASTRDVGREMIERAETAVDELAVPARSGPPPAKLR